MTDDTTPAASGSGTPWHFWVVGILSLLWNGFGAYLFVMGNTQGDAFYRAAGASEAMIAYTHSMPGWMLAPWIAGVWGALLGSIAFLVRSRWAVWLFAVSLVGAAVSAFYQYVIDSILEVEGSNPAMPLIITAVAAFLWWYAGRMAARGVLR
ncbi:MAG: hypothetical protein J0L52_11960 [Caulobacterales bacterium]|nr:hypothetical protein [Caulobacterales bacterium]